jgi:hypothetical protein
MSMRSLVSPIVLLSILVSIFTTSSWVYAQNKDTEYENMSSINMVDVSATDEFVQIENSIEKPLIDTKDIKNAHKYAINYISSLEPYDIHWTGKHPKMIGKWVPYYTDDENTPIVYEWKIRCDDIKDCGSVIVATIDGVSRVMEAGTYGLANYERLGKNKKSQKNKLYYYSAFDQYIESSDGKTTTIDMIDPEKQLKKSASERKEELKWEKEKRKEMRKSGKTQFETEVPNNWSSLQQVIAPTVAIDVSPMTPTAWCQSALPCYQQFQQTYWSSTQCWSGCTPTAMTIIFGYYDRKWLFPNLYGNSTQLAPDSGNTDATLIGIVNSVRGFMQTYCTAISGGAGATTPWLTMWVGMQYVRNRGYTNSPDGIYSSWLATPLFLRIKTEINAARPLIVNYGSATTGHTLAAYGYNDTGAIGTSQLHVNYWFWASFPDKYISISVAIAWSSTTNDGNNAIIWQTLKSIVTVPVRN